MLDTGQDHVATESADLVDKMLAVDSQALDVIWRLHREMFQVREPRETNTAP